MLKPFFKTLLCFLLAVSCVKSFAQNVDSLLNLSAFTEESDLQKLLNKNLSLSSQKALTSRETPGIISVVTAEEIRNSGARDMMDVLRLVPGFDIAQDLQFVLGLGLRGNWANEGKVLVMLDGQPFNELLYQTVAFGNRFPVDAIERVEIIRGPGSAIYGGSAEYGVINIITKAASTLDGVAVYGTGGFHANATGRTNAGIMAAKKGEKVSWDLSLFKGNGLVSDRNFEDFDGSAFDLTKVTHADPMNINAGLRYNNFSLRTMYDQYNTSDPYSEISFKQYYVDARYKIGSERLSLTPQIQYLNQVPWFWDDYSTDEVDFKIKAERIKAHVDGSYDFSRKVNLNFGVLYFHDKGTDVLDYSSFDGSNTIDLDNYAVYTQALFKHVWFNATAGFRWEKNNRYGSAFVPRLAITKKIENFHFKLLYSESFRAPSIQNINLPKDDEPNKPERSNVFEFEFGYQFTPEMLLAINAFNISTKDVLIFGSEGSGDDYVEWYSNEDKSGSRGLELVYTIRKSKWYATLTYSYNQAIDGNTVEVYRVPQTSKQYVGFANHKMTLQANYYLTDRLSLNCTGVYMGERYAYNSLDVNEEPVIGKLDPFLLMNTFVNYRSIFPGFDLGAGVYDMLGSQPPVVQAYNGGYAPIPGRSREYVIKISYQINFRKQS